MLSQGNPTMQRVFFYTANESSIVICFGSKRSRPL